MSFCYSEANHRAGTRYHVEYSIYLFHRNRFSKRCPDAPGNARLGAVSFIHRFGDGLNEHIHYHCCVIDALFYLDEGELRISELPSLGKADIAAIQTRVSRRVLRWFVRRGLLDPDDAHAMREWHNDMGFSLDAAVRIPAWDRAALERLLRYCARPSFALERLEAIDDEHLRYHSSKPQPDGTTELSLTPLDLIDRIAALVPPPRVHRHCYHGVLAPNSPLRVTKSPPCSRKRRRTSRWEKWRGEMGSSFVAQELTRWSRYLRSRFRIRFLRLSHDSADRR